MISKYNWRISDIEMLAPWEREVYITLIVANEERKKEQNMQNSIMQGNNF
jgi:hypothetical protein